MNFSSTAIVLSFALISGSVQAVPAIPAKLPTSIEQKINLNTASLEDLMHAIKGIGKHRAEAILHYRQAHGAFKNLTDLSNVRGIGIRFVQKHREELEKRFAL